MKPNLLSVLFLFLTATFYGQTAELNAKIKQTDAAMQAIDKHVDADSLIINKAVLTDSSGNSVSCTITGYIFSGVIERIVSVYQDDTGNKVELFCYYSENKLIWLQCEYYTELAMVEPGFYITEYRGAHYISNGVPYYKNFEGVPAKVPEVFRNTGSLIQYCENAYRLLQERHKAGK